MAKDRRPIDPPPIIQLIVTGKANAKAQGNKTSALPTDIRATCLEDTAQLTHNLRNPGYFMVASLYRPEEDIELRFLNVNTRFLIQPASVRSLMIIDVY